MFSWLNSRRGQNTAEYAILIGVIVAAAIAMQVYIRRGMQARVKDAVDYTKNMDQDSSFNFVNQSMVQYEPYYYQSNLETTQAGNVAEALQQGGGLVKDSMTDVTQRTGNQVYGNYTTANQ